MDGGHILDMTINRLDVDKQAYRQAFLRSTLGEPKKPIDMQKMIKLSIQAIVAGHIGLLDMIVDMLTPAQTVELTNARIHTSKADRPMTLADFAVQDTPHATNAISASFLCIFFKRGMKLVDAEALRIAMKLITLHGDMQNCDVSLEIMFANCYGLHDHKEDLLRHAAEAGNCKAIRFLSDIGADSGVVEEVTGDTLMHLVVRGANKRRLELKGEIDGRAAQDMCRADCAAMTAIIDLKPDLLGTVNACGNTPVFNALNVPRLADMAYGMLCFQLRFTETTAGTPYVPTGNAGKVRFRRMPVAVTRSIRLMRELSKHVVAKDPTDVAFLIDPIL